MYQEDAVEVYLKPLPLSPSQTGMFKSIKKKEPSAANEEEKKELITVSLEASKDIKQVKPSRVCECAIL